MSPGQQRMAFRRERVKRLHAEGLLIAEIAERLGVVHSVVQKDCYALGLKPPPRTDGVYVDLNACGRTRRKKEARR